MSKQYAVISSVEGDWHIAAYREKNATVFLFQGHSLEQCYEAVLKDLGVEVNLVERDLSKGNYFPKKKDFAKPSKRDKCTTKTKK
jgi:hypothetical protein